MRKLLYALFWMALGFIWFFLLVTSLQAKTIEVKYTITSRYSKSSATPSSLPSQVRKTTSRGLSVSKPVGDIQERVYEATCRTFSCDDWEAMRFIISHESGFEPCKINGGAVDCNYNGERAAGLGQALPMQKMGCSSLKDVDCQINWLMGYIRNRYENPQLAYQFWTQHNYY